MSHTQHVSDLHSKFALRPCHVWSMVDIQSLTTEIRRGKKRRRNNRMKILWPALLHRAVITMVINWLIWIWCFCCYWVDLITLEGEMSVRQWVRSCVRPSTKSFSDLNEIWYVDRGRWLMYTVCRMIRFKDKVKVTGLLKFRKLHFSRSMLSTIYNVSWQMTTDF